MVGRPGLDPGTLRVFPERPLTSISVQICWSDEGQCPPTSTEVHSRLFSWLDLGSFQGHVTIRFRETDGECDMVNESASYVRYATYHSS